MRRRGRVRARLLPRPDAGPTSSSHSNARSASPRRRDLPIIIHCREAFADVYALLRRVGPAHRGVMHCFSGDTDQALEAVDLGLHVSFAGPLTYPKNVESRRPSPSAAGPGPDRDRLPVPPAGGKRGKRNEPSFLPFLVHDGGAGARESPAEAARRTSANAGPCSGFRSALTRTEWSGPGRSKT